MLQDAVSAARLLCAGLCVLLGVAAVASERPQAAAIALAGEQPRALVAVAANFSETARLLATRFEAATGGPVVVSSGSTGKLYAQIVHGAPYHVFLAADQERPRRLEAESLVLPGKRITYANGRLTILARVGFTQWTRDVPVSPAVRTIALANPSLAPYGRAAEEYLATVASDPVATRRVYVENVAQAFALVQTGNADLGFVALSQVLAAGIDAAQYVPVPAVAYPEVQQDGVLLVNAAGNVTAEAFFEYLSSNDARALIREAGYGVGSEGG